MAHVGALPKIQRHITTHDPKTGKAIFSNAIPTESIMTPLPDNMAFALSYTTKGLPVDLNADADLKTYSNFLANPPGLVNSTGTVLRHVDFPPSNTPVMHRTVSIDYGCVLEGKIICVLDSGEEREMGRGDVCVQRGTMHAWRNPSSTEWCRMLFVLQPCKEIELGEGAKLGEDLGNAVGIRSSE